MDLPKRTCKDRGGGTDTCSHSELRSTGPAFGGNACNPARRPCKGVRAASGAGGQRAYNNGGTFTFNSEDAYDGKERTTQPNAPPTPTAPSTSKTCHSTS